MAPHFGRSLVVALAVAGAAHAAPYAFTNVADTSGPLSSISPLVSLNNVGTVAFQSALDMGGQAVFTGRGGALTTISNTPFTGGARAPSINDAGTVAFVGTPSPGVTGVYMGSGGALTTIDDTTQGQHVRYGQVAINNSGLVAARAQYASGVQDVFGSIRGQTFNYSGGSVFSERPIALNDNGIVAFEYGAESGGQVGGIIYSRGPTRPSGVPGPFDCFSGPSLGVGSFTMAAYATCTQIRVERQSIVDTSGAFASLRDPSINNAGVVAFHAELDAGGRGIFTGPDSLLDRVIATGDLLFGSTLVDLPGASNRYFNDLGQIAFSYVLADGRSGVARADPGTGSGGGATPVPEPASLALFLAAAVAMLFARAPRPISSFDTDPTLYGKALRKRWRSLACLRHS